MFDSLIQESFRKTSPLFFRTSASVSCLFRFSPHFFSIKLMLKNTFSILKKSNEIFLSSDGYNSESLKSHWQLCYTNNVEKINVCGYCGKEFKNPNSFNDEWRMVEHLMRCGGKNDKKGTKRKECLGRVAISRVNA